MRNESVQVGTNYTNSGNVAKKKKKKSIKQNGDKDKKKKWSQNGWEDARVKDLNDVWINMICSSTHFTLWVCEIEMHLVSENNLYFNLNQKNSI